MKFLINLTNKQITVIAVIFILALAFYWYEWRPRQIKRDCYSEATETAITVYCYAVGKLHPEEKEKCFTARSFNFETQNTYYKNCLVREGL